MVSKASRLLAKGEMVYFETENGTVDFNIKPLKNKEFLEILDVAEKNDMKSMLLKMLYYSLIKDDPELTFKDIEEMDTAYLVELINIIKKVNKLEKMFDFQEGGQGINQMTLKSASKPELLAQLRTQLQEQRR